MKFLRIILILTFFSCTSVTTFEDRQIDKNASFAVTKKFYDALEEKDLDKIFPLFNFNQDPNEALQQKKALYLSLRATRDKFGDIESYDVVSNETKVTEGSSPKTGEYHVVVRIKRTKIDKFFEDKFVMFLLNDRLVINNYDSRPL
jgi:hypothetical protein